MTSTTTDCPNDFSYKRFTLFEAIDALMAYDVGARDSGIADDGMKQAVSDYLNSLNDADCRRVLAVFGRRYLTDEAIAGGYGIEDVREFAEWMESCLG